MVHLFVLLGQQVVGETLTILEASDRKETNLGNFMTDAMINYVRDERKLFVITFSTTIKCSAF